MYLYPLLTILLPIIIQFLKRVAQNLYGVPKPLYWWQAADAMMAHASLPWQRAGPHQTDRSAAACLRGPVELPC